MECPELWAAYQAAQQARIAQQAVVNEKQLAVNVANAEIQVIQAELIEAQQNQMTKAAALSQAQMDLMPLWMNEMSLIGQYQNQGCPFPGNA